MYRCKPADTFVFRFSDTKSRRQIPIDSLIYRYIRFVIFVTENSLGAIDIFFPKIQKKRSYHEKEIYDFNFVVAKSF